VNLTTSNAISGDYSVNSDMNLRQRRGSTLVLFSTIWKYWAS